METSSVMSTCTATNTAKRMFSRLLRSGLPAFQKIAYQTATSSTERPAVVPYVPAMTENQTWRTASSVRFSTPAMPTLCKNS